MSILTYPIISDKNILTIMRGTTFGNLEPFDLSSLTFKNVKLETNISRCKNWKEYDIFAVLFETPMEYDGNEIIAFIKPKKQYTQWEFEELFHFDSARDYDPERIIGVQYIPGDKNGIMIR